MTDLYDLDAEAMSEGFDSHADKLRHLRELRDTWDECRFQKQLDEEENDQTN